MPCCDTPPKPPRIKGVELCSFGGGRLPIVPHLFSIRPYKKQTEFMDNTKIVNTFASVKKLQTYDSDEKTVSVTRDEGERSAADADDVLKQCLIHGQPERG